VTKPPKQDPAETPDHRRFVRERQARLAAEAIAEQGLRDLYQRQQEIQLLGTISEAANSATSVDEAMQSALGAICAYARWPTGRYSLIITDAVDGNSHIIPSDRWYRLEPQHSSSDPGITQRANELGLAARVLEEGTPLWVDENGTTAFAVPVWAGQEVAAVLEFLGPRSGPPDQTRRDLFHNIGIQLGRVVERERARAQSVDALHDPLTRLPNRALFLRFVERALKRKDRYPGYQFAVLFIDLDRFKAVNDSLGHRAGDTLLLQIGHRLAESVRGTDTVGRLGAVVAGAQPVGTVARLGGDEFTVLIEDIGDASHALQVAGRIHDALSTPFALENGVELYTSASIGIAWNRSLQASAEDVLQDADIAMYRAKAAGKSRSEIFDEYMHKQAIARLAIETDLRRAVSHGQLWLAYQPIVLLQSGELVGLEALVRWNHPTSGTVPPSDFIPIAEEQGTILEIGSWVLREACRQLGVWQQSFGIPNLTMAVNLSAKQFAQAEFVDGIADVLRASEIRPACLSLELTETIAMGSPIESRHKLAALRQMGIDLALDDFGTGHSSLSYLSQFRVSTLKIDRSFIQQLNEDRGETLVRSVVGLGKNLGLRVIAEGIESARERDHLQKLGCVYGQGYHFQKPLQARELEAVLAARPPASPPKPQT